MRFPRRLSRVLLGLALGLLVLEGALWALYFVRGAVSGGRETPAGGLGSTWLAIGDSHTYGWSVAASATWPARLEALFGEQGVSVHCVNAALPGQNTANLLEGLPAQLERYRPELVFVLAGLNNPYSRPHEEGALGGWLRHTRTWRLWRAIAQRFESRPAHDTGAPAASGERFETVKLSDDVTEVHARTRDGEERVFRIGGGTLKSGEGELGREWIRRDLEAICSAVRTAGAKPVLLTYAREQGDLVPAANLATRKAAAAAGAALIDVAVEMQPGLAGADPERLFFADLHPRREGYEVVARIVHDRLVDLGLAAAPRLGDPWIALRAAEAPQPRLAWSRDPAGVPCLDLGYESGLSFTVFLARAAGSGPHFGEHVIELAQDDLFERSKKEASLSGEFGADGRARVSLAPELVVAIGAPPAFAVLVARTRNWTVQAVSAPVEWRP